LDRRKATSSTLTQFFPITSRLAVDGTPSLNEGRHDD